MAEALDCLMFQVWLRQCPPFTLVSGTAPGIAPPLLLKVNGCLDWSSNIWCLRGVSLLKVSHIDTKFCDAAATSIYFLLYRLTVPFRLPATRANLSVQVPIPILHPKRNKNQLFRHGNIISWWPIFTKLFLWLPNITHCELFMSTIAPKECARKQQSCLSTLNQHQPN